MPDDENPYDEFLKSLAKMVEDIMKDMPDEEHARFIGCTIIAGGIPGGPPFFQGMEGNNREIKYEIIESDERIYITTQLPPDIKKALLPGHQLICLDSSLS